MEPCTSYAPGRALPINECERCHRMRHEHEVAHRSLPTGSGQAVAVTLPQGTVTPRIEEKPTIHYCRACSAGLIIKPPHTPDSYDCPQCGHSGPKSSHPTSQMPDEKNVQRAAPSLELPPILAAIKTAHDEAHAELSSPEMQAAEQQVEATILAENVSKILMPWKSDSLQQEAAESPEGEK